MVTNLYRYCQQYAPTSHRTEQNRADAKRLLGLDVARTSSMNDVCGLATPLVTYVLSCEHDLRNPKSCTYRVQDQCLIVDVEHRMILG